MREAHPRSCRVCRGSLESILDLGHLHPSAFPAPGEQLPPPVPLDLCACVSCRLVQLRHTVDPDALFRQYWYRSAINEVMRAELADIVAQACQRVPLVAGDVVVDVGANDGTLLSCYSRPFADGRVIRIGFEPADNLQDALAPHADVCVHDYFPGADALRERVRGQVKVLTSVAMFYDLDDPGCFVQAVAEALHPDGVWIVQFQDLHQMIQAAAFDNICHEHLCYYSLGSFERLIARYGLHVVDAEVRAINGGSYRLYVQHARGRTPSARAVQIAAAEGGCDDWEALERFAWRVGEARRQIQGAIHAVRQQGWTIDLYGASTKANTLLQYCGLDQEVIRQAWERAPEKIGRQTVTGIPIVGEVEGRASAADALLVGIWQFREAILAREADYLDRGGVIVFPLPHVDLVQQQRVVPS